MKLICESINDIDKKIEIFTLEKERLQKENNKDRLYRVEKELETLTSTKQKYIDNLSQMDGIEYRLYAYLLKGYNPMKAIDKVGEENYLKDVKPTTKQGILPYYKNMKKICRLD